MLLVSYPYDISERQTAKVADLNLPVEYFLGSGVNEHSPDDSTLSAFVRRVLENGKLETLQGILVEIVRLAQETGNQFASIEVIDSMDRVADVNAQREEWRQRGRKAPGD